MNADDSRHGTTRGYHAGCRDICCRRAIARYEKAGRLARLQGGRAVPALGSQRRIQALMRLGWTSSDIADAAGWTHRNQVFRILKGQKGRPCVWLQRSTAEAVRDVYERLSMSLPEPTPTRARTRAKAQRMGWAPPLAWDDIDDPNERPHVGTDRWGRTRAADIDEVVVARILAGDWRLSCTAAEKAAVVAAWEGSHNELARLTGWRVERYTKRSEDVA